jgi:aryl-alcohol dehydrogenase-like predicted oxidoreductase
MQLGDPAVSDADAERLLRRALELGAGLIDTARSYGRSEERIGRFLGPHRDRFILSTKLGYGVEGVPDWTGEAVTRGVEEARARLRTDVIDIVHLHSCDLATLQAGEVVEALAEAVDRGFVRLAAYSGENEALAHAVGTGAFPVVQASVNVCDQAALAGPLARAAAASVGILAKRPLATAPWRSRGTEPVYAARFRVISAEAGPVEDWADAALRFAAFAPGVSACLVGTRRVEALESAARSIAKGPLPGELLGRLAGAFERHGEGWGGLI